MSEKYTPGPWYIDVIHVMSRSGKFVATVPGYRGHEANASLIAAAPELLEALEELLGWQTLAPAEAVEAARAAIAKAGGE